MNDPLINSSRPNTTNFYCWCAKNESNALVDILLILFQALILKHLHLFYSYFVVTMSNKGTKRTGKSVGEENISQKKLRSSNNDDNSLKKASQSCQRQNTIGYIVNKTV